MDDELDGTPGARPHLRRLLSFDCTGFVEEDRSEDRIVWRRHDADATLALEYASRSFWSDLASDVREAAVLERLRDEMTLAVPRWVREPDGDPLGAVPWRPTHADLSKWDTLIPDHPLSVVRRILDATIASLRLAPWTEGALLPLPSPGSGWV